MKPQPPWRVLKLGGSLLAWPPVARELERWLAAREPCRTLMIVGGGELADAVRQLDRRFGLSPLAAHMQAIRAMQLNAYVVCQLGTDWVWVPRLAQLGTLTRATTQRSTTAFVLDPLPYMLLDEPQPDGQRLPALWQVTSDSIAARLAQQVNACELVLFKSSLPGAPSVEYAARTGYVDEYLPVSAAAVPHVRAVNLRDPTWPEVVLQTS